MSSWPVMSWTLLTESMGEVPESVVPKRVAAAAAAAGATPNCASVARSAGAASDVKKGCVATTHGELAYDGPPHGGAVNTASTRTSILQQRAGQPNVHVMQSPPHTPLLLL